FSFENISGNGAAMYIDNINIPGAPTGVQSVTSTPSVNVYPNPTGGQFTIGLANVSGNAYARIYNVLGQEVTVASLKNGSNNLDLGTQSKGIYIYRIFSETGSAISTGRLVIE
ncbi:MAG TPA: T9SS type A sorting domain-containing protein, partial [Bacteroidia bacterium]|nr:T9SS type A sorting domain-containing protein [Bacteroidia bacterium]